MLPAMEYKEEAAALWHSYVPARGQADTVQGELIRAIEKLRDEAQRNGNVNWCKGHVILANYVGNQLVGSGLFDTAGVAEITSNISRVLDFDHPETADFPYDELTDRVVQWSRTHPQSVARERNPDLHL